MNSVFTKTSKKKVKKLNTKISSWLTRNKEATRKIPNISSQVSWRLRCLGWSEIVQWFGFRVWIYCWSSKSRWISVCKRVPEDSRVIVVWKKHRHNWGQYFCRPNLTFLLSKFLQQNQFSGRKWIPCGDTTREDEPKKRRRVKVVIVGPEFESGLDPGEHFVVGELARVPRHPHVPLRLLVKELQDFRVPETNLLYRKVMALFIVFFYSILRFVLPNFDLLSFAEENVSPQNHLGLMGIALVLGARRGMSKPLQKVRPLSPDLQRAVVGFQLHLWRNKGCEWIINPNLPPRGQKPPKRVTHVWGNVAPLNWTTRRPQNVPPRATKPQIWKEGEPEAANILRSTLTRRLAEQN